MIAVSAPAATEPTISMFTASDDQYAALVGRIRQGDDEAAGELYERINRGLRYLLYRQLGRGCAEDKCQDVFLITLSAIRSGNIENPRALLGFVRGVARNLICGEIKNRQAERGKVIDIETPGLVLPARERAEDIYERESQLAFARQVLAELSLRDREILKRFYLLEQSAEQIMSEMGLSETQFRLTKSRAKQRFADLGRKTMQRGQIRVAAMAARA